MIDGSPNWNGKWNKQWYGVKRFFEYLESKAYKMHIRVLLVEVPQLHAVPGLRRRAAEARGAAVAPRHRRTMPTRCCRRRSASCRSASTWSREQLEALPGLRLHDLMQLPIDRMRRFFDALVAAERRVLDEALKLLLDEIAHAPEVPVRRRPRLPARSTARAARSRGGEVQRINLTTALGTSLVNTMFVLDEPSIGLHPRDMDRIVEAMHRLRDAGNTLVVVEHDPAVMLAADRADRHGPRPGRARRPHRLRRHARRDQARRHADRRLPRRAQAGRHGASSGWSARRTPQADRSKARASTT